MSRDDFKIRLDLNENPYDVLELLKDEIIDKLQKNSFNRYPDPKCTKLRDRISDYTGLDPGCITVGNGSDELIMMIFQTFLKEEDKLLLQRPSFSMYKYYAGLVGAKVIEYSADQSFNINIKEFKKLADMEKPKMIIICNPNNPTGKLLNNAQLEKVVEGFEGLLIIDEAYCEFGGNSSVELLKRYKNVILLRTFSKALGLAGLRIGYMLADPEVIGAVDRVRSPFNVNSYSQAAAAAVLENIEKINTCISTIRAERERVFNRLSMLQDIEAFESETNFILIRAEKKEEIYKALLSKGILTRSFEDEMLRGCIRITIGTAEENDELLKVLEAM